MNKFAWYVLCAGLGITFFVIGVMIVQAPESWAELIQPWALKFIPGSVITAMVQTGYLDMVIGILFVIGPTMWIAGLLGSIHLVVVLVTTGINSITVRDVGLIAATLAVFIQMFPWQWLTRLRSRGGPSRASGEGRGV